MEHPLPRSGGAVSKETETPSIRVRVRVRVKVRVRLCRTARKESETERPLITTIWVYMQRAYIR